MLNLITTILLMDNKNPSFRLQGLITAMRNTWTIEEEDYNSASAKAAYSMYRDYIILQKENCRAYDAMKAAFTFAFDAAVAEWIVCYTNYFQRTPYLIKRGWMDRASTTHIVLLNN